MADDTKFVSAVGAMRVLIPRRDATISNGRDLMGLFVSSLCSFIAVRVSDNNRKN